MSWYYPVQFSDNFWCDTDFLDVKNKKVWVDWFSLRKIVFQDSNCGTRKMSNYITFRKFSCFRAMKMWTKQTLNVEWETYVNLKIMTRVSYIYKKKSSKKQKYLNCLHDYLYILYHKCHTFQGLVVFIVIVVGCITTIVHGYRNNRRNNVSNYNN